MTGAAVGSFALVRVRVAAYRAGRQQLALRDLELAPRDRRLARRERLGERRVIGRLLPAALLDLGGGGALAVSRVGALRCRSRGEREGEAGEIG